MRAGHGLILIVVALLLFGVVMVTSAGASVGAEAVPMTWLGVLSSRPALMAATAVVLMLVAARIPVDGLWRLRGVASPVPWIVAGSIALLLLVHVPGIGREVNGARRWIDLGPFGFQPSELAKWGLPFVLAWHATRRAGSMHRLGPGLAAPLALIGLLCALIAKEDLGTAVLVGLVAMLMLLAAGVRFRQVVLTIPLGAAGFVAAVLASPYRVERLRTFLDPYADPQGGGYHVLQSMAAVAGGGLAGAGLGNGLQKFGYLPEDTTDFIFAVIAEEIGVAGIAMVLALYAALLFCGLSIVNRCVHPFARLLGLGILLTIGLQALINMLVVTGLAPTKGIALPLISWGGTGWCLTAFCLGLIVSIDRTAAAVDGAPVAAPAEAGHAPVGAVPSA